MAIRQPKGVEHVSAASRPPDAVALGSERQAEPALPDRLVIDDLPFMEVDERQLVGVVAARGGQRVAVVGQRDDVQRQVGQRDVLAGRLQGPAVGQEESLVRRPGESRWSPGPGTRR